jgi:hypothetical protein
MPHPVFLLQAAMRLRGKVLKKDENPSDRDYSGGGYYYQRSIAIYLREDHSFLYEERTFSSVRAGELSSSLESPTIRQEGTWKIEFRNESPHLVLRQPDDSVFREWAVKDGGINIEYLDGVGWNKYQIA